MIEAKVVKSPDMDKIIKSIANNLGVSLRKGAIVLTGTAANLAPRDTSRLADSITYSIGNFVSTVKSKAKDSDKVSKSNDNKAAFIGTNVEYAAINEYGGIKTKHKAQPYLRPVIDNERKNVLNIFMDGVAKGLRKIWEAGGFF